MTEDGLIPDEDLGISRDDAAVSALCSTDYTEFLKQAKISSLTEL